MEPWYKIATPRQEVREGRSFNPDEFAIALEQDEVLNFINRHRDRAEAFYAFVDNLVRSMTARAHAAALISLPRSQVEMTDWDVMWQERPTKVVRRVAKDLIANDETEISEVVRRRLFPSSSENGKRFPSISRPGGPWPCWRNGSPGRTGMGINGHDANH